MAHNRIQQAKVTASELLKRSYVNRDRIALISFRDHSANVILAASNSATRAARILESLPVGGSTPLASALLRSLEVAQKSAKQTGVRTALIIITDGRANVSLDGRRIATGEVTRVDIEREVVTLGSQLKRQRVTSILIDTAKPFLSEGRGKVVANALGARYVQLTSPAGRI